MPKRRARTLAAAASTIASGLCKTIYTVVSTRGDHNQTEQRIVSLAQQEAQAKLAEAQAQNGKAENPLSQEEYIQLYFDAKAVFSGGNVEALHAFLNSEVANGYLTAQGAEALRKLVYTSEQYQP